MIAVVAMRKQVEVVGISTQRGNGHDHDIYPTRWKDVAQKQSFTKILIHSSTTS